ncbi:MAG TPA: hypothetical protein VGG12_03955 [Methylovirgula sp.]|jgi:hypothetical protein
MNTANLQLEGLLLSLSALFETMRRKGLLTTEEIERALDDAEAGAKRADRLEPLSDANLDAIQFPIRFLRIATNLTSGQRVSFSELAAMIGEMKEHP